ncbi:kinase-like protein [Xylariaceae sp. FL0255]|nr:kinase-like protein [Xylariaceae sp. FL0255]
MDEDVTADIVGDEKPVLITSSLLGPPPYVLDPSDLSEAFQPIKSKGGLRQIDEHTLVKYGGAVTLAEAEAMDFVARNTDIKVPKVIGAYELNGTAYIIMSFEEGRPLWDFWKDASLEEKETVIGHLQKCLTQMRSLKGDYVGGFNRSPCTSDEFQWDMDTSGSYKYGPYADEHAFNEGLLEAYARAHPGQLSTDLESSEYNRMYATRQLVHSLRDHEIVFTHGDLNASNILVQHDLTVVILDWNSAGYFPAYWEWYKATWHGVFKPSFIRQVERYIPPYWMEANIMLQIHAKILG